MVGKSIAVKLNIQRIFIVIVLRDRASKKTHLLQEIGAQRGYTLYLSLWKFRQLADLV